MQNETLWADVFYLDKRAGTLIKTRTGYEYVYDPTYLADPAARPISFSMPLQGDKYVSQRLFSFFDGLLPEGWLLDLISATTKIDKDNKFGLLLHTGSDPIGAVSIRSGEGNPQ